MSNSAKRAGEATGGIGGGFLSLLTVLFIGLKLTDQIDWSWWLVLSPLLLPFGIIAAILLIVSFAAALRAALK